MEKCEKCGKDFDKWETSVAFESINFASLPARYDRFGRSLCFACAIEEYQDGNYFEICECCEKQFHPETELLSFEKNLLIKKLHFNMYDFGILCADCAKKLVLNGKEYERFCQARIRVSAKRKE